MSRLAIVFAFAISCLIALPLPAQETSGSAEDSSLAEIGEATLGKIVDIRTKGGGSFRGVLYAIAEDRIEIAEADGQITGISKSSIISLVAEDPFRDRAEYFQDSASNRLILMPTGFGMEAGEFHVAAQEIIVITGSYGISPHFSVWGGVSIPGAVVNLRWSSQAGAGSAVSLGSFVGLVWLGDAAYLALPYAIASFGHPNRNLTVGAGIPLYWSASEPVRPAGAVAAIGSKIIVSPTASIVTENWVTAIGAGWPWSSLDLYLFPAAVFRIAGSRLSWDIGAILPLSLVSGGSFGLGGPMGGTIFPLPILSLTYRID